MEKDIFLCARCSKKVRNGVVCDKCEKKEHYRCANVKDEEKREMIEGKKIWTCEKCDKVGLDHNGVDSKMGKNTHGRVNGIDGIQLMELVQEVRELKKEVRELKHRDEQREEEVKGLKKEVQELRQREEQREDEWIDIISDRLVWEFEVKVKMEYVSESIKTVIEEKKIDNCDSVSRAKWEEKIEERNEMFLDRLMSIKQDMKQLKLQTEVIDHVAKELIEIAVEEHTNSEQEGNLLPKLGEIPRVDEEREEENEDQYLTNELIDIALEEHTSSDKEVNLLLKEGEIPREDEEREEENEKRYLTLLMGDVGGREAGEFCKEDQNRAKCELGIRLKQMKKRMEENYYRDDITKNVNVVVIQVGNREVNDGMNRREIIREFVAMINAAKKSFGQNVKLVIVGLKSVAGRYINEGLEKVVVDMGERFIVPKYIPGFALNKREWEVKNGRELRVLMNKQISKTNLDNTVFQTRWFWKKIR